MRLQLFLISIFLFFHLSLKAQEVPNPPERYTPLIDQIGLLSDSIANDLKTRMVSYEDSSSTQIVFAIIDSLYGKAPEAFSNTWAESWGIGQKGADNGLLLLISLKDKVIRFEVGYGLEAKLTDSYCNRLITQILQPNFRDEKYGKGLDQTFDLITQKLEDTFHEKKDRVDPQEIVEYQPTFYDKLNRFVETWVFHLFILAIGLIHLLIAYLLFYRRKFPKRFRTVLIFNLVATLISWFLLSTGDALYDESFCFSILFFFGVGIFILQLILLISTLKGRRVGSWNGGEILKYIGIFIWKTIAAAMLAGGAAVAVGNINEDVALPTFLILFIPLWIWYLRSKGGGRSGSSSTGTRTYSGRKKSFFNSNSSSSYGGSSSSGNSSYSDTSSYSDSSSNNWGGGSFGGGGATGSW